MSWHFFGFSIANWSWTTAPDFFLVYFSLNILCLSELVTVVDRNPHIAPGYPCRWVSWSVLGGASRTAIASASHFLPFLVPCSMVRNSELSYLPPQGMDYTSPRVPYRHKPTKSHTARWSRG